MEQIITNKKGSLFVRCKMNGLGDDDINIIIFNDKTQMTMKYVIEEVQRRIFTAVTNNKSIKRRRKRKMDKHSQYYLVEEQYKNELTNNTALQHGRTYVCKRKWCNK